MLKEGDLERLDVVNLVEEIEDLGIRAKKAVRSNLVVVLLHLLKHQFQPRRRSRSWLRQHRWSIASGSATTCAPAPASEAMRRTSSMRPTPMPGPAPAPRPACAEQRFPPEPPYTLEQTLDPDFLPD